MTITRHPDFGKVDGITRYPFKKYKENNIVKVALPRYLKLEEGIIFHGNNIVGSIIQDAGKNETLLGVDNVRFIPSESLGVG